MEPELKKTTVKSFARVLEPEWIVEDVVREFPETLAAAAQSHRVPIEALLQELEHALTRSR